MTDMTSVIQPKSDQLNSDSLQAGPLTILITEVTVTPGEQPVTVRYQGDNGKPWKPCKSMARVLVAAWGPDASKYKGRHLILFRDPKVTWGGMEVGGIRISHMSHIDGPLTLALTATRGNKKPFKVLPLKIASEPAPPAFDIVEFARIVAIEVEASTDTDELAAWWQSREGDRLKARDTDRAKAGEIATTVAEKIAALRENAP
jgi:hypothetical protein